MAIACRLYSNQLVQIQALREELTCEIKVTEVSGF